MGLLAPLFLVGLVGLAVPIVVHLFHRQRKDPVRFPSLMFLERIPFRTVRRQTLRDPLLFALRALALALIVLAFTRPVLTGTDLLGSAEGAREIVVLLDRSYSMSHGDRFTRAQDAARTVLDGFRTGDAVTLVTFDVDAQILERSSTEPFNVRGTVDTLQPGSAVTRLGPALKVAQSVLEPSPRGEREVVIVSDFQDDAWTGSEDVLLPPGTRVLTHDVSEDQPSNVLIATASVEQSGSNSRESAVVSARIVNQGPDAISGYPVRLELDGQELETVEVDLGPAGSGEQTAAVRFEPFVLARIDAQATVSIGADELTVDDEFHMVLSPEAGFSVLVLEPAGARPEQSFFLSRALAIGTEPGFDVDVRRVRNFQLDDLVDRSVVVLNGTPPPSGNAFDAVMRFVENGGGLLVALDERSAWPSGQTSLIGGSFGSPTSRSESRGGALGYLDFAHPVFELFQTARGGDFTGARFYRYRPFTPDSTVDVLARFDDGAVALGEVRYGEGRILVWTGGLDSFWSDLPLQAVYLPFVQSLVRHLSGRAARPPQHVVGELVDMSVLGIDTEEGDLIALSPKGSEIRIAPDSAGASYLKLEEHGYYEVRWDEVGAEGTPVAVNADRVESDLTSIDPAIVTATLAPTVDGEGGAAPTSRLDLAEQERRQSAWRYMLWIVLALLMLETWMSNRQVRSTRLRPVRPGG